ncbi:MAG: carbohydrate porin [Nitrospirae bacterium]|nr:carbohydrate porin [Candidatus Manganitrophaceae bacterium]
MRTIPHILETYYNVQIRSALQAALDDQFVAHPAYNRARGPVSIFGARVYLEF